MELLIVPSMPVCKISVDANIPVFVAKQPNVPLGTHARYRSEGCMKLATNQIGIGITFKKNLKNFQVSPMRPSEGLFPS